MKLRIPLLIIGASILLQIVFIPYISTKSFRPDIPLLVILYFAARRGSFSGVIAGFFTGLLVDSFSAGFFGLSCMAYSVAGFISGKLFYFEIPLPLTRWMLASATGTFIWGLIHGYFYALHENPGFGMLMLVHVLPAVAYTWILGFIWAISPLYEKRSKLLKNP
ncbi:rod shape-determining protein MreD [Calditrichota bacterium]